MKLGLHVPVFAWEGGSDALADHLSNVAEAAEAAGFDQITVMDHLFALGDDYRKPDARGLHRTRFHRRRTTRMRLGTQVTGVTYRHPAS